MPKKILLFDGFSILNRGFYALPLLTNSAGEYTNAVYGFLSIFFRFMDEEKPDYVTVAFDLPQPTFRHELYGPYKGTRKSMPDELRPQIPLLKNLLNKMNIPVSECPGFEADDVLGTLAAKAEALGLKTVIVSGDRDLLQLATEKVLIRLPRTKAGKTEVEDYFSRDVTEKYGVTPSAYIDVKALMGDASDNIPGVPGIGEVTATKIIAAYGSVEKAIERAEEIKPKKASENLMQYREQALISKTLAAIAVNAPVELTLDETMDIWNREAYDEFMRLELKTFYGRFRKEQASMSEYTLISDRDGAAAFIHSLMHCSQDHEAEQLSFAGSDAAPVAFHLLTSMYPGTADKPCIAGIGFSAEGRPPVYLGGFGEMELLTITREFFESDIPKLSYDSKRERQILRKYGIRLSHVVFDAMLAAYVLNAIKPNTGIRDIALEYLNETAPALEELLENKGKRDKDRRDVSGLPLDVSAGYAARAADIINRAYPLMKNALSEKGQQALYEKIELPLANVLAGMESFGIKVDREALRGYGQNLEEKISVLREHIHQMAGADFNIQSPSQLGVILFDKLGLKGAKKTTQGWSTAADVLEKLAGKHPIVPLVLEYRAYAKLKSTYVDGLLPLIRPETSRVHSTFHQALTATGRISSAEPNLQNIPIRMPLGRGLRKSFIPEEGFVFADADYSQIELRVLAHMSGDETLIRAFHEGQDIHRLTASQVLRIPAEEVTPEQRGNAKAVNFGIIYGISAFGLSEDLKISKKEAERYIQGYFEKYPKVKEYMDITIANAYKDGYVSTLFNRRRAVPELKSSNFNQRSFGERVAMNMPIQGSAADIIKIAMVQVARRLDKEKLASRLILQVHDELLLEVKKEELDRVKIFLKDEMENAACLSVPLVAEVREGESWYDTW